MNRKKSKKPSPRSNGRNLPSPGPAWLVHVYSTLAILGIALPWYFNIQAFSGGMNMVKFFEGAFQNPAAASIAVDITVACAAFFFWLFIEARRVGVAR
ncbi:MAG: DUF2834 domain-containing protein, partial [Proteobacteria bacterium]|nr:DUF2834 domain-containing protein [Pseudomonadota bacterium]